MIQLSSRENRSLLQVKPQKNLYERYAEMSRRQQKNFRILFIERLNVSPRTVYYWIEGKRTPRPMEQEAIAQYFKALPTEIWFDSIV